jgi:DNA-binding NarL/FixJ family response regulator
MNNEISAHPALAEKPSHGASHMYEVENLVPRAAARQTPMWPHFLNGQPDKPVRVLLIDDDVHIRNVISQELLRDSRTHLVAQGASMRDGRSLIREHQFDVMLVDLNLGDGSGFELIQHLKLVRPMAEAVVISATEDEQYALRAFELGATGYLVKSSWFGSFPEALLQVVNGGASISPILARRLLRKLEQPRIPVTAVSQAADREAKLTLREREVLKMVSTGCTSGEIAAYLEISCQTVNTHIKNIYRKLQIRTRSQAAIFATHRGMI